MAAPHIFLADDDAIVARTIALVLEHAGYRVSQFSSAEAALAAAALHAPDLLITDVLKSGLSGIELGCVLQTWYPRCQVLVFTGHASVYELLDAAGKAAGSFQVLLRPAHPTLLLDRVRALLGRSRAKARTSGC